MDTTPNSRKPGKKRIMVQIWRPAAKAITNDLKALHIKRDGYLNDLFTREIEELAEEVSFRNSDEVRARFQEQKLPERKPLTLELDESLVERMDTVLKERNIPRDSFVNRVLFFLVAKKPLLERLGIAFERRGSNSGKPLKAVQGFLYDPFLHIREANDGLFYTLSCFSKWSFGTNGPNLFALNTAITPADWTAMNTNSDDLLGEIGLLQE